MGNSKNYIKTTWAQGALITEDALNNIEDQIEKLSDGPDSGVIHYNINQFNNSDDNQNISPANQKQARVNIQAASAQNVVLVADSLPSDSSENKIWLQSTGDEYSLPEMSDFNKIKQAIATEFSAQTNYKKDDYVWYEGVLYKFTAAHSAGAWAGNTDTDIANISSIASSCFTLKRLPTNVQQIPAEKYAIRNLDYGEYYCPGASASNAYAEDRPINSSFRLIVFPRTNSSNYKIYVAFTGTGKLYMAKYDSSDLENDLPLSWTSTVEPSTITALEETVASYNTSITNLQSTTADLTATVNRLDNLNYEFITYTNADLTNNGYLSKDDGKIYAASNFHTSDPILLKNIEAITISEIGWAKDAILVAFYTTEEARGGTLAEGGDWLKDVDEVLVGVYRLNDAAAITTTVSIPEYAVSMRICNKTNGYNLNLTVKKRRIDSANDKTEQKIEWLAKTYSSMPADKIIHFSLDDVSIVQHINAASGLASIWEEPFFNQLHQLHFGQEQNGMYPNATNICITLNCFTASDANVAIQNLPDTWQSELQAASSWLRFAYHGPSNVKLTTLTTSALSEDYNNFSTGIKKLTGNTNYNSIDKITRLSQFSGSLEQLEALRDADANCIGFLSADTGTRSSYYFNLNNSAWIFNHRMYLDKNEQLIFLKTYYRLDSASANDLITQFEKESPRFIEIFGHVSNVSGENNTTFEGISSSMLAKIATILTWTNNNNYKHAFPMDFFV